MNILSENQLDELPSNTLVWMIISNSVSHFYLRIPLDMNYEPDIVGFLEKQDVEQIINLLKPHGAYQNLNISAECELLAEVRNGARLYEQQIYIFDHSLASEFFVVLPEILESYKSIRP